MLTLEQLVDIAHPADRVYPEAGGLSARTISERLWASDDDGDMEEKAGFAFKKLGTKTHPGNLGQKRFPQKHKSTLPGNLGQKRRSV